MINLKEDSPYYEVLTTTDDNGQFKVRCRSDIDTAIGFRRISPALVVHTIFKEGNRKVYYQVYGTYKTKEQAKYVSDTQKALANVNSNMTMKPVKPKQKWDNFKAGLFNRDEVLTGDQKFYDDYVAGLSEEGDIPLEYTWFEKRTILQDLTNPGTGSQPARDPEVAANETPEEKKVRLLRNAKISAGKRWKSWIKAGIIREIL